MTVDGKVATVGHPHPGKLQSAFFYLHIGTGDTAAIRRFEFVVRAGPVKDGGTAVGWGSVSDPDKDCSVAQDGQTLTIDVPAVAHDLVARENRTNGPRVLQELEGDFLIQVKVCGELRPTTPGTVPGHVSYQSGGILVWADARNFIRLERAAMNRGNSVRSLAALEMHVGGQVTASPSLPVKDEDTYLRLQRRGNQILGSVSQDGQEWTSLQALNVSLPAKVGVGVAVINAAKQPLKVRYEELKIDRDPPAADRR
jgi:regulation of enolase protein 1 (concanavalin A-like superfamily)